MSFFQRLRAEAARRKAARAERAWQRHKLAWWLEDAISEAWPGIPVRVEYARRRYRVVQGPPSLKGKAFTVDGLMEQVQAMRCQAHVNRPSEIEA